MARRRAHTARVWQGQLWEPGLSCVLPSWQSLPPAVVGLVRTLEELVRSRLSAGDQAQDLHWH